MKQKVTKTAVFQYKCRSCRIIFDGEHTSEELARQYLNHAVYGFDLQSGLIGIPISLISTHVCKYGQGVADLLGYNVRINVRTEE